MLSIVQQANEMLFCGRKLTAQEACSRGLVSQVFWPTTFNQEVMLRVKEMAACNAVVSARLSSQSVSHSARQPTVCRHSIHHQWDLKARNPTQQFGVALVVTSHKTHVAVIDLHQSHCLINVIDDTG